MAKARYIYNLKTLRFERAGVSIINVLATALSLLSFGVLFFMGLFLLQNKLIISAAEKALEAENESLQSHRVLLTSKIHQANANLELLEGEEEKLYTKFFDLALAKEKPAKYKELMLAEPARFQEELESLGELLNQSKTKARINNSHYALYASVRKEDVSQIVDFPGSMPVANIEPKMLVSGFGTRINPWHKGKYHHDGVDIAGARGTPVLATGNGRVIASKKSDLQGGFGNYVEIEHGYGFITRYTHLGEVLVKAGQKIKKGDTIATIGVSGGSIAPHVHYEVLKNGKNIDPIIMMVEGIGAREFDLLVIASRQLNQSLD